MRNLWPQIQTLLLSATNPSRYFSLDKIPVPGKNDISVCLVYPDTAEIGLSNTGLSVLFNILNSSEFRVQPCLPAGRGSEPKNDVNSKSNLIDECQAGKEFKDNNKANQSRTPNPEPRTVGVYADMAFAPWFDMEGVLRESNTPLFSYFNCLAVADFDIIGISLPHELCYTNVLNILDISGLKIKSSERREGPLVIAGGTGAFNPSVMEKYFDAFVVGDGEDAIVEITNSFIKGDTKENNLKRIEEINGIYIPGSQKTVQKRVSKMGGKKVLNYCTRVVHEHNSIEVMRGCVAGCRFCQAGYLNRPVREKSPLLIKEEAKRAISDNGLNKISLLSLSTSDYSCIDSLSKDLSNEFMQQRVSLNLPSLRMDSFSVGLAANVSIVNKNNLTFAPEAGSQSLRDAINKNIDDSQIEETIKTAFEKGFGKIKLYFMIGLPGESQDDIEGIITTVKKIRQMARDHLKGSFPRIVVNISTFVPKPHTPLQWSAQITKEEIIDKQNYLKRNINAIRDVTVKCHDDGQSVLEGLISRGDAKIGSVIETAWEKGLRFDSWTEYFKPEIWQEAADENGVDIDSYLQERDLDEKLPWSNIDCLVSEDYFLEELRKYSTGEKTKSCRIKCGDCGVCKGEIKNVFADTRYKIQDAGNKLGRDKRYKIQDEEFGLNRTENAGLESYHESCILNPASRNNSNQQEPIYKYELLITKENKARYLSHLEFINIISRALRRTGMPLAYTKGFNPRTKISFERALSLGKESQGEKAVIRLTEEFTDYDNMKEMLNNCLPEEIRVISVGKHVKKKKIKISNPAD